MSRFSRRGRNGPLRRRRAVFTAIALALFALLLPAVPADAATAASGTIRLQAETPWIGASGALSLALRIRSTLAPGALAIRIELYSSLPNRAAFDFSESNAELPSERCLDDTLLPLTSLNGTTTSGVATFHLQFVGEGTTVPCGSDGTTFNLFCTPGNCADVYPLAVTLLDSATGAPLDSFTTHVVDLDGASRTDSLRVGLVLPLANSPALGANGHSTLTAAEVNDLVTELRVLASRGSSRLTIAAYPELLLSLQRLARAGGTKSVGAKQALTLLTTLVGPASTEKSLEVLGTPFVPLDVSSLAAANLPGDFSAALNRGLAALETFLGREVPQDPYVAPAALDPAGLHVLEQDCTHEVVVPEASVPEEVSSQLTPTAPVELPGGACASGEHDQPVAFVSDSGLTKDFQVGRAGAALAAENVLAELAQVYFELPNALGPRAVVIAPARVPGGTTFLTDVLSGLASSPILRSSTLESIYSAVPVGSNPTVNIVTGTLGKADPNEHLPAGAIVRARHVLAAVTSVVANDGLSQRLHDSLFLAESAGLTTSDRNGYLAAPTDELRHLSGELAIVADRTVTLTARTGKVPITITSTAGEPVTVVVRLESSALEFRSAPRETVPISARNFQDVIEVSSRTSGESALDIELLTPVGLMQIGHGSLLIRSTAASGVAVVISIAALLVLAIWWGRSLLGRRGRRRRGLGDEDPAAAGT